jgi:hypothetical protein
MLVNGVFVAMRNKEDELTMSRHQVLLVGFLLL